MAWTRRTYLQLVVKWKVEIDMMNYPSNCIILPRLADKDHASQVVKGWKIGMIKWVELTGPPSPFPLFLIPYLMDTPCVWYRWKGIFKDYLSVSITWRTDHFPRATSAFTGSWPPTHIVNISPLYPRSPPFGPFPLPLFKFYDSSISILRVLEVVLRQNFMVY